ncbi:MAG: FAD-binding oxidoreductase [Saccharospirillum sp.]|nr:FAD-binding oxidoreductase [Saccharospirillum sp.]
MNELIHALRGLLGPSQVLTGDDVHQRTVSWFDHSPSQAAAIIRPASTEEVVQALALCRDASVSVVPMGGRTGVVAGVRALPNQIGLSLERMTGMEPVDVDNRSITVEAGVPLQRVHEVAREQGLHFPVDLGARGSCTIGGMVSTNAGGNEVLRYGMMREQVLGLEAVMADGQVVSSLRPLMKDNTGYDLKQLFIGSEGSLGIVTRVTLKLRPLHHSLSTAWVAVETFAHLPPLLRQLERQLGGRLSAFEVMWRDHVDLIAGQDSPHTPPLENNSAYYVLVQAANYHESERATFELALESALEQALISNAAIASSEAQQAKMWAIRDDIEQLTRKMAPSAGFDVSLPIKAMEAYVEELKTSLTHQWPQAKLIVFGHLGDGNLHLFINIGDAMDDAQRRAVERLVYSPLQRINGSISAEHGIGLDKKAYLSLSRSDTEITIMKQLKKALDPLGLLNPGVIFE